MSYLRPHLGDDPAPVVPFYGIPLGTPQAPISPLVVGNNGCYECVRATSAQGSCGGGPYPCKHPGTDVNGMQGTTVVAPENGTIVAVSAGASSPFGGYGPWVIVIQGNDSGKFHLLGHLDPATSSMSAINDVVQAGQAIGTTSSANHTHWEVRDKLTPNFAANETNFDNNSDPETWLATAPILDAVGGSNGAILIGAGAVLLWLLYKRSR